ncbi:MAG TPA: hypothetical protein VKE98_18965, partial [Gemmataceae bacterium]|nr:hypothetical protein [Gemmataceae bacterium]
RFQAMRTAPPITGRPAALAASATPTAWAREITQTRWNFAHPTSGCSGMRRYRRAERQITETICAENNQHLFDYHIPVAHEPDF